MSLSNLLIQNNNTIYCKKLICDEVDTNIFDSQQINTASISSIGYAIPPTLLITPDGSTPQPINIPGSSNVLLSGSGSVHLIIKSDFSTNPAPNNFGWEDNQSPASAKFTYDQFSNPTLLLTINNNSVFGYNPNNSIAFSDLEIQTNLTQTGKTYNMPDTSGQLALTQSYVNCVYSPGVSGGITYTYPTNVPINFIDSESPTDWVAYNFVQRNGGTARYVGTVTKKFNVISNIGCRITGLPACNFLHNYLVNNVPAYSNCFSINSDIYYTNLSFSNIITLNQDDDINSDITNLNVPDNKIEFYYYYFMITEIA